MSTELIYGIHAVSALLERTPERFIEVWALKGRDDDRLQPLLTELESLGLKVQSVNRKTLDDKAEGNNHQGIMAKVIEAPKLAEHDLASLLDSLAEQQTQPFLLVLDGVTDPHNLGACLRSADAAGVHAVIVPRDKATGKNAKEMARKQAEIKKEKAKSAQRHEKRKEGKDHGKSDKGGRAKPSNRRPSKNARDKAKSTK